MPLYEYECEAENGRRFEIIQKFSDEALTVCPTCGGPVRKLISSPAIQFKGSGFYINDYAKKSRTDGGRESKGSSSSSDSSSGSSGSSGASSSSGASDSSGSSGSSGSSSSSTATPASTTTPAKKD
jgi:putative FmdB family regulatory protein